MGREVYPQQSRSGSGGQAVPVVAESPQTVLRSRVALPAAKQTKFSGKTISSAFGPYFVESMTQ